MEQRPNKTIVTEFYKNIVRERKSELIPNYVHQNYVQHSPMGKDGREGLFEMIEFLKTLPPSDETTPSPIVNILAEGDFVVTHLDMHFMGRHTELMELFRIQDGLAAEHWDVTADQTSEDMPLVNIKGLSNKTGLSNRDYIVDLYSKLGTVIIHHLVVDSDYIAVHAELKQGVESTALFDIFKFEDGRVTEHQYVKQQVPERMMHSNGMF